MLSKSKPNNGKIISNEILHPKAHRRHSTVIYMYYVTSVAGTELESRLVGRKKGRTEKGHRNATSKSAHAPDARASSGYADLRKCYR